MPSSQKTPLSSSLNAFAQQKVMETIHQLGKALPCSVVSVSGPIVTVAFAVTGPYNLPHVTMPLFGPEYIRYPIQVGDLGVTFPIDVYLGGISGLGTPGAVADITQPQGNLSNLVFMPCGNRNWSASEDANAVVIYGPDGTVIRDTGKTATVTTRPNAITLTAASITLKGNIFLDGPVSQINSTGGSTTMEVIGPVNVTNDVVAGTISLEDHVHTGVQTGSGNTGGPVG